jgi:predicted  nucleic acid-binding Zn-ribbon protein
MSEEPESTSNADDVEKVQLNIRVDKPAKEGAKEKLPHGGLTREINEYLNDIAFGNGRIADVQSDLQDLRDERRQKRAERDYLNEQLEDLDIRIERLEEELQELLVE